MSMLKNLLSLVENEADNTAKSNITALSGAPDFELGKVTKSPFKPEDEKYINTEAIIELFENCGYILKLLYRGLGAKYPVAERFSNQDALDEFKEIVKQKISMAPYFNLKQLTRMYNVELSNLNSKIDKIGKLNKKFSSTMKIVEIYDALEDLYNYLIPLMRQIADNENHPTFTQAVDLATRLDQPIMYKNPLLCYIYDLSGSVTR